MTRQRDSNPFGASRTLRTAGGNLLVYSLPALADAGIIRAPDLPRSILVLLESVIRNLNIASVTESDVRNLASWDARAVPATEVPFLPARVLLQDFTGVPAVVDLAAMRDAMTELGGDPRRINPLVPVDLVIDHSVQVDAFGSAEALGINTDLEFVRNAERYELLRWGQRALRNFRVVPPGMGICHQVNLEYLAAVVVNREVEGRRVAFPDTLVGTDSHTTMVNGLGVVGWGVGGIEAEAVMLGQPLYMLMPEVVGFRLTGQLPEGATATDLVLTVTQMLRLQGVVGKFVEFYGSGLSSMSLADRATIANMAPEYGATLGFFPVDAETLDYLRRTGRPAEQVDLVERYTKEQGLFRTDADPDPQFSDTLDLDLATVQPSLAGPKRPQDRVLLREMKKSFSTALRAPLSERGFALKEQELTHEGTITTAGKSATVGHGTVVIAAITSCTNTSNPAVMLAAGLLAKKACARGLRVKPHVKTSLAPGSPVVSQYLREAGLTPYLEQLGFHHVGYGCTTCIGNSGPLPEPVAEAIRQHDLVVAAVLSGNRNFEGRIHPLVRANYLASPPLVVAYALAGTVHIDLTTEPLGTDERGRPVYLHDVWPRQAEVHEAVNRFVKPEQFHTQYAHVFSGSAAWQRLRCPSGDTYAWDAASTYVQKPPFFEGLRREAAAPTPICGARVLVMLGDSVTTDHISPAGSIHPDSPAGQYLQEHGVTPGNFNSYGARRGNDRVMTRGTFANIRLRNLLVPGSEGGVTVHLPSGTQMSVFDAAQRYRAEGTPLLVVAGKEYGTGSSRDWAAKGTLLLGVRAVLAESYERIHRSNLVGMGVLPLQFRAGQDRASLGITGRELFDVPPISEDFRPRQELQLIVTDPRTGVSRKVACQCRLDTPVEVDYYRQGGILPAVLRRLLA
ncbi:MAG TPA: aconitate hydratase AcnA [Phycisphaerae bacterium]|nr:aconitate hydratase AcnA [Phycisphaerae bacterium]HNU46282.1 aconitate hydratase AcnA [Phycisphaerae bacterium]